MAKYKVTIEEIVTEDFEVEANNLDEAIELAERKYNSCEFVLEPGNLTCTRMNVGDTDWIEIM